MNGAAWPLRPPYPLLVAGLALAAAVAVGGCGRSGELAPPNARWGEDVCAACNMIASEERHAAAAAVDSGDGRVETRLYDDIGCLLADEAGAGDLRFLARWVHDLSEVRWIAAESAIFVISPDLRTPMGSGVAAFAARERAREFVEGNGGELVDWDGLRQRQRTAGLLAPPPGGS